MKTHCFALANYINSILDARFPSYCETLVLLLLLPQCDQTRNFSPAFMRTIHLGTRGFFMQFVGPYEGISGYLNNTNAS